MIRPSFHKVGNDWRVVTVLNKWRIGFSSTDIPYFSTSFGISSREADLPVFNFFIPSFSSSYSSTILLKGGFFVRHASILGINHIRVFDKMATTVARNCMVCHKEKWIIFIMAPMPTLPKPFTCFSSRCFHRVAINNLLEPFQENLGGLWAEIKWAEIKSTDIEWKTSIFEVHNSRHIITNFYPHQFFFTVWWRFRYVVKSPLRRLENKCSLAFLVITPAWAPRAERMTIVYRCWKHGTSTASFWLIHAIRHPVFNLDYKCTIIL